MQIIQLRQLLYALSLYTVVAAALSYFYRNQPYFQLFIIGSHTAIIIKSHLFFNKPHFQAAIFT